MKQTTTENFRFEMA